MPDKTGLQKMAVIGDRSVLGFMAAGFAVRTAENETEAARHLHALAAENYAVIFITEQLAEKIEEEIIKYREAPLPAIITIPGREAGRLWYWKYQKIGRTRGRRGKIV